MEISMPNPRSAVHCDRVATYSRMSTDHQRYSIENQAAAMDAYAQAHGLEVVKTYADPGRSGVTLRKRPGLTQLLGDVLAGEHRFSALLVYDVSRWGRFQDVDESAHYEFVLRRAGVPVVYCAEPFENDGTPLTAILKAIKRSMAGEYSRDLSVRVAASHMRGARLSQRQGGVPMLGFRRELHDENGQPRGPLWAGERKWLPGGHVRLAHASDGEVRIVRYIFRLFAAGNLSQQQLVDHLNREGVPRRDGGRWTINIIRRLLVTETYIGVGIYRRTTVPLGGAVIHHPKSEWVRAPGAVEPIVDPKLFQRVQRQLRRWREPVPESELLKPLRALFERRGRLSRHIIDACPDCWSAQTYSSRFGTIDEAYRRVGYFPKLDTRYRVLVAPLLAIREAKVGELNELADAAGLKLEPWDGIWRIAGRILEVRTVRCLIRPNGLLNWDFTTKRQQVPDLRLVIRMQPENVEVLDYLLLPACDRPEHHVVFSSRKRKASDRFRFERLADVVTEIERLTSAGGSGA